jgi:hypothetical protein
VHGKPRIKLPLTEEAPLSTTKSDGMWEILPPTTALDSRLRKK